MSGIPFYNDLKFRYALFIFCAVFAIYLPSTQISFFGDETAFVLRTKIDSFSSLIHSFDKKEYDSDYYRPLVNFLGGLISGSFGLNAVYYRIFNSLHHALNSVIFFYFVFLLFGKNSGKLNIALAAALIFGMFPINDLAVIWHTALYDRTLFTFYILALYFYLKKKKPDIAVILFFSAALLSKEMSFSFPLVIFAVSFSGERKIKKAFLHALPFAALIIIFLVIRALIFDNNVLFSDRTHPDFTPIAAALNYAKYFSLLVFPFFYYSLADLIHSCLYLVIAAVLLSGSFYLFLFVKYKDHKKELILPVVILIILLIPVSRLFMKWYAYLPSAFFGIAAAALLNGNSDFKGPRKFLKLIVIIVFAAELVSVQMRWIGTTQMADKILSRFKTEFVSVLSSADSVTFVTTPSKISGIPVWQLDFGSHLRYHLDREIFVGILSRVSLGDFSRKIDYERSGSAFSLNVYGTDFFILYGLEKNYKFDRNDFKDGLLQRIKVNLSESESKNPVFMFSKEKFFRIENE